MRKLAYFLAGIAIALGLGMYSMAHAQVTQNFWIFASNYLKPAVSTWGVQIPSISGLTQCLHVDTNGKISGTGADCGAGGGGTFPFTPTANFGTTTSATSTPLWLRGSLYSLFASSTAVFDNATATKATFTSVWVNGFTAGSPYFDSTGFLRNHATTSAVAASQDVWRDGNSNIFANNFVSNVTSVVAAGGTTVLTPSDSRYQILTGSANQTYQLPNANASGMQVGSDFRFNNNTANGFILTVTDHGGNIITRVPYGGFVDVYETDSGSANGVWDNHPSGSHLDSFGRFTAGLGTTTPYARLSIQARDGDTATTLFAIGSSTASATTTLFSVNNIGTTTIGRFGTCNTTKALTTDSSGNIICGTITAASTNAIGTTSPWTAGQLAYVVDNSTVTSVATTTHSFSGPFTISGTIGALVGGTNSTITWNGLATTSQPASSNLLVSNGGAGVYGVATSTLTASSPLTGSFTQVGSGGSLGCQTASGSQAGCLSAANWNTFNNKWDLSSTTIGAAYGGTGSTTLSGILKGNGTGIVQTAVGDTDYQKPITLTTTGTSGAATFSGDTLNIPQYTGGGGGNISGWATSTPYGSQLLLYPTNGTEDVAFGGTGTGATTTAPFWWDVNATTTYIGNGGVGDSFETLGPNNHEWTLGVASSTATSPFDFILASSTNLSTVPFLTITKSGTYTLNKLNTSGFVGGNNGTLYTFATSTIKTSQLTNDAGFLTSAVTSVAGTWPIISSGGATPTISFGWATTSQPSSSNLFVSDGASGFYGVATSTLIAGTNISFSGGTPVIVGSSDVTINATGGSGTFAWTPTSNFGTTTSATSTPLWLRGNLYSLFASSTAVFDNASTTKLSISSLTSSRIPFATTGGMLIDTPTFTIKQANASDTDLFIGPQDFSTSTAQLYAHPSAGSGTGKGLLYLQNNNGGSNVTVSAADNLTYYISTDGATGEIINLGRAGGADSVSIRHSSSNSYGNLELSQVKTSDKTFSFPNVTGTIGVGLATTSGSLAYWGGTSGLNAVATSSATLGLGLSGLLTTIGSGQSLSISTSSLFTLSPGLSSDANLLHTVEHHSFTYATTSWTGTTTVPLEVAYGEVWNSVRCFTDAGTVNVDFYHASSHLNLLNASTTIGTFTFASNNTMTTGDQVKVDIGTPASSPTRLTCTVKDTN